MLIIGGAANQKSPVCVVSDGKNFDFDVPSDALPFFNRLQGNFNAFCYTKSMLGHQLVEINNFVFVLGGEYVNSENKKVVSSNVYW